MSFNSGKLYTWLLFLGLFSCSSSVLSACVKGNVTAIPVAYAPSDFQISGSVPVGSKIGDTGVLSTTATGGRYFFYCSGTNRYLNFKLTYPGVSSTMSSIEGVYEIAPGLGMRLSLTEGGVTYYASPAGENVLMAQDNVYPRLFQFNLEYYKIGPLTSSVTLQPTTYINPLASLTANSGATPNPVVVATTGKGGNGVIEVVNPTCSVNTPSLTFPIGDVQASSLTVVGATGHEKKMTMTLNCQANANIRMTLNGTQHPDVSDKSVLSLDNQGANGVAKGVGVQFIQNGIPLVLGQTSLAKVATAGSNVIDITARYYQTKTDVVPGLANASALLQVTYQ